MSGRDGCSREGEEEDLKVRVVTVARGDLAAACVDVIVNAANEHLRHGGGLAAALAAEGGEDFLADSERWVSENGPVRSGEAAVTVAGRLQAAWVVHVVGPRHREGQDNPALLREAVRPLWTPPPGSAPRPWPCRRSPRECSAIRWTPPPG